jgi:hypothetical protein
VDTVRINLKDKKNRNMENVPSAEYFIEYMLNVENNETIVSSPRKLSYILTEFAKLHVGAALKAVSENAYVEYVEMTSGEIFDYTDVITDDDIDIVINKDSILESYPMENIK